MVDLSVPCLASQCYGWPVKVMVCLTVPCYDWPVSAMVALSVPWLACMWCVWPDSTIVGLSVLWLACQYHSLRVSVMDGL